MNHRTRGNHGARVATTVIVLAFASSLSIRADDQTAASSSALPVVTLTQCVEPALSGGPGIRLPNATVASANAQYTVSAVNQIEK